MNSLIEGADGGDMANLERASHRFTAGRLGGTERASLQACIGEHLSIMAALSEQCFALPNPWEGIEKGYNREKTRVLDDSLSGIADLRKALLRQTVITHPDLAGLQAAALAAGQSLVEKAEFSPREALTVEYELSFLGVNLKRKEFFSPEILRYIASPELAWEGRWVEERRNLVHDMGEYEKARWLYSRDGKYTDDDLGDYTWCGVSEFEALQDELVKFLNGKTRVLEIGFLHQHLYDQVMKAAPQVEYHGVDISVPAVLIARRKGLTVFPCNAWYAIPYPDGYFDGIVSSTVRAAGLRENAEMRRVLKDPDAILNFDMQ